MPPRQGCFPIRQPIPIKVESFSCQRQHVMQAVLKQLNQLYVDLQVVSGAAVGICYGSLLGIQLIATRSKVSRWFHSPPPPPGDCTHPRPHRS